MERTSPDRSTDQVRLGHHDRHGRWSQDSAVAAGASRSGDRFNHVPL